MAIRAPLLSILILPIIALIIIAVTALMFHPFTFDTFFYMALPIVGIIALLTKPFIDFLVFYRKIPLAARKIWEASEKKQPIAVIVHDSGRAGIHMIVERRGEGVVVTDHGKYQLLPRYVSEEELEAPEVKDGNPNPKDNPAPKKPEGVREKIQKIYSDWIVKRAILIGFDLPIFFGYSGSLCLFNPEALALYEAGDLMIQSASDKPLFNPQKNPKKHIADALQPLMLLDPRKIKSIINRTFDHSQIAAIIVDSEEIGRIGRGFGRFLLPIGLIVLVLMVVLVLFLIFGSGKPLI